MARNLMPPQEPSGLSWAEFEGLVASLTDELLHAERRFGIFVEALRNSEIELFETRNLLEKLTEMTDKYAEGVAKLQAIGQLIQDRLGHVECVLGKLESIDYHPHRINTARQLMYTQVVDFNDNFLKDVKSMTEIKLALKRLDDQMIKLYNIDSVKNGLNTMINLLSFLSKAIEYLENETKTILKK